ncbi:MULTISPECIES: hypothetical protein [Bartonella]|uniref:hypothetical protein n=1 Tax=Bartonella TaxID=773 RepID=UPI00235F465A|nr:MULTISPECIES: hypothetical protein [Bartonella]
MALFPFSIADIDDPECIRVVLYASGRMGHAPLNALLKKVYEDMTKISKRMEALEKNLNTPDLANVKQKQNAKKDDQSNMNTIVSSGITVSDTKMNASEIKIEASADKSRMNTIVGSGITVSDTKMNASGIKMESPVDTSSFLSQFTMSDIPKRDYSSFISQFTSMKTPEIYSNADHNIKIGPSRNPYAFLKKKK